MPDTGIIALSVDFPGVSRVLEEGEKIGLWNFVRLHDGAEIPPAEIYLFGAWHPVYAQLMGLKGVKGVLWTSSAGEMDFTGVETSFLDQILKDERVNFVWFGDKALATIYAKKGFYAPYPLALPQPWPQLTKLENTMTLFCPEGPKKNILNQLLAAQIVQEKHSFVLETNVQVPELLHDSLKSRFYSWLPRDRYHEVLGRAQVNFACSWAETFSYQAAEAALLGIPTVGSHTIPWLPREHCVENPNNPMEIAQIAMNIIGSGPYLRAKLAEYATQHNQLLKEALARFSTRVG